MRIIECYVENFGKLSAYTHRFDGGLNCTLAENGWGKTTLSVFIKAMFYGLGAERTRSIDDNERKKYAPWQGGRYGGSLTFERGGRLYRIERSFGARAADDVFRLVDAATGSNSTDFSENLGLELFDIDAAGFERTVFLSEKNLSGPINNDSIAAKLSDLVGTTGDVGAVSGALARLEDRRKFYQKRGNTGEIAILRTRISECESRIGMLERKREELDTKELAIKDVTARIRELGAERDTAQTKLASARAESESRSFREQYAKMKAELEYDKSEFRTLEEFFASGVPTHFEIDEARDAARDAEALKAARRDYESPELTELRGFFGRDTDFSEIESIKQVYRAEREADAEASAVEAKISFAEATLKDELGGRLPDPKELDSCISAVGSKKMRIFAIALAAAAVLLGALFFITPYMLIPAAIMAAASFAIAMISLGRTKRAYSMATALGISNPSQLPVLRERLAAHLSVKETDGARAAKLREEQEKLATRLRAFTSSYPHGKSDMSVAIAEIDEKYKRYYSLAELSRANESARAGIDIRIDHLERRAKEFTEKYEVIGADPFETVRTRLDSYLYARRTLSKREDDLKQFAILHGITDELPRAAEIGEDPASIMQAVAEIEAKILAARREEALLESEYATLLSDVDRIDELKAERDGYVEKLEVSVENLEVIKRTMDMLTEASDAMTARYIGGTKARFEHYLELVGDGGEFAMGTDFALKKVDRGETRVAESYSKGTRDLYAFCLRLALSDALWGGELPFVMLDDPFATLDTERLGRAKALLCGLAKEKQVIYFTCSKERTI